MLNIDYAEKLKECVTINDVENLFEKATFNNRGRSGFFNDSVALVDSGNVITNAAVKVDGFLGLLFRLTLFLKLDGHLGVKPLNSGEASYFNALHTLFVDISEIKKISKIEDFDSELIDNYIVLQSKKENKATTTVRKIKSAFEIIYYAEDLELPYFLRYDEYLFAHSLEYKKHDKLYKMEAREKGLITNAKEPYPLNKLKIIISNSIEYLEKYSDEVLKISEFFMLTKGCYPDRKYSQAFDFFKTTEVEFTEPRLKELQAKIKTFKNKYLNDGINNLGRHPEIGANREILHRVIEELEASCISISLMMTGMRVGELCVLNRNLRITHDEHYHLERIVYKTAATENGECLEMPIPSVCKKALEVLSKLSFIKDPENNDSLILSAASEGAVKTVRTSRISAILNKYCTKLGLDEAIEPHQFRHAMAFLIVHIHESEGLELARMFLGHTSIVMTLQYMGNFNNEIKDAISELHKEESDHFVGLIAEQIQNNKKIFGENGKRLMPNNKFVGHQVDDFVKLMRKGLLSLVQDGKLAIIQTPISLCMHDLSKPEDLVCQRGFDINEIVASGPSPSRCKGASCANALFFEEHVEKLKNEMYVNVDSSLRERLEQNTYFMDAGGFEQDPFRRIIREYNKHKEEAV